MTIKAFSILTHCVVVALRGEMTKAFINLSQPPDSDSRPVETFLSDIRNKPVDIKPPSKSKWKQRKFVSKTTNL